MAEQITKPIKSFKIDSDYYKSNDNLIKKIKEKIEENKGRYCELYKSFCLIYDNNGLIVSKNKGVIWQKINGLLWANFYNKSNIPKITNYGKPAVEKKLNDVVMLDGSMPCRLPTTLEINTIKAVLKGLANDLGNTFACTKADVLRHYDVRYERDYSPCSNMNLLAVGKTTVKAANPKEFFENVVFKYGLFPDKLGAGTKQLFDDFCKLYKYGVITLQPKNIYFNMDGLKEMVNKASETGLYDILPSDISEIMKSSNDDYGSIKEMDASSFTNSLLKCEKVRADIDPYDEKLLTDPNSGHWDLWEESTGKEAVSVEFDKTYYAKNPVEDVNENGIVAIDFGTKSTVVVYQRDTNHSLPMAIGDGKLKKGLSKNRYENPTIMHFVNPDKFLKAYRKKEGRPSTSWADLTISHTANSQFEASDSDHYASFLRQIKQWAGDEKRQLTINPNKGKSFVLPAFSDLKDGEIDPIEIYAYYIGLYINNMRNGIFLNYYLSFPVTYSINTRNKITESFKRGLKKSLPITVIHNKVFENFDVNGETSEPAAYAVCALKNYGFRPKEGEAVFYGVFDFGGGTTDFDFGIWKKYPKKRYDYVIKNFGGGGNKFLGGENLLERLAYKVFLDNRELMLENEYCFTLPGGENDFMGSEALISNSQAAEKNMHNLAEALRPYWEVKTAKKDKIKPNEGSLEAAAVLENNSELSENEIKVNLFNNSGELKTEVELKIKKSEIDKFIEDKIREGVVSFCSALTAAFESAKDENVSGVNIFLAGNSCKSPVVRKVFDEELAKIEADRNKTMKDKGMQKAGSRKLFEIFPPLGEPEAIAKMKERGIPVDEKTLHEGATGKTGVAFGLVDCRKGGKIKVIKAKTDPFWYFIGWEEEDLFKPLIDEKELLTNIGKPDYNRWYEFYDELNEGKNDLEIYYTEQPEFISGNLKIGDPRIKRVRCRVDAPNDEYKFYIRAVSHKVLEYAAAKSPESIDKKNIFSIELEGWA
ncbi:MAG: hypothetical protein LUG66_10655 [Clostridiales bacterium]|nr:hypothetical protein [Clostridiales bacterium]